MKQKAVSLKNVFFKYGNHHDVLKNVSLDIEEGEFLGIIGPNGGGKTTLLKLIMGFLKPSSGEVLVFGMPPHEVGTQIAYVPQNLRYDRQFPISVLELVLSGRLSHLPWHGLYTRQDKEIALTALERVGLLEYQNAPFGSLSGGQSQRVLIARALAAQPKLLLLDEPTASVDAQAEADICSLLTELKESMTMLMVTHDLRTMIRAVQRVICVQQSVYTLKPEEVCEHFAMGLYHPPLIKLNGQSS